MYNILAPICLFTYNRIKQTKETINALKANILASESELYIFCDGPKNKIDSRNVRELRAYLHTVSGFKSIYIIESAINKGLANSVISGVSEILKKHESVIVLEDDILTVPNFLLFMNQALQHFDSNNKIGSISGYVMDLPSQKTIDSDYFTYTRPSSWGWAIWSNRWFKINWDIGNINNSQKRKFAMVGSDLPVMLDNQINKRVDSWAVRLAYHQFINQLETVYPMKSKVKNIGLGQDSTHTKQGSHFNPSNFQSDGKKQFNFSNNIQFENNTQLGKEFRNVFLKRTRLLNKIKNYAKIFQK